jgi:hypothetical protein
MKGGMVKGQGGDPMKKLSILFLVLAILVTSVVLAGCFKLPNLNDVIKTSDGSLSITSEGITVKGDDGSVTQIGGASLPTGYPSTTLPLIAGATVTASSKSTNDKGDVYLVYATSTKTVTELKTYYENIMKNTTDYSTFTSGDLITYAGKKDNWDCYVQIIGGDENTLALTLSRY